MLRPVFQLVLFCATCTFLFVSSKYLGDFWLEMRSPRMERMVFRVSVLMFFSILGYSPLVLVANYRCRHLVLYLHPTEGAKVRVWCCTRSGPNGVARPSCQVSIAEHHQKICTLAPVISGVSGPSKLLNSHTNFCIGGL